MSDKRLMLKIKSKSLAEEARIIRKEEKRTNGTTHDALHHHRVIKVRREARDTYIAYGFIRGTSYSSIEPHTREDRIGPNWSNVGSMCKRYGDWKNPVNIEEMKK